ncbi:hypothetical protein [Alteromonas halophila]|uniref:Toprim domain-containing protein n=1 Tax=Alteromonas halophila TaxID=516698 RepID=A0A918MZ16_9ALTE|nr:hypothetical protein [Alteromonas halophila]GGW87323.1 hypothetical protein GCM10007391_21520 [Alteromonas halophila]
MTKSELALFQANLFTSSPISGDTHIIERQAPMAVQFYHRSLLGSAKPMAFTHSILGLSRETIDEFNIGFCDRTLSLEFPYHKTREGIKLRGGFKRIGLLNGETGHETMRGCITLPLVTDGELVGLYGLRYSTPRRKQPSLKCSVFGHMPVFIPFEPQKLALVCDNPFVALGLAERGYRNGVTILGDDWCELASSELKRNGIETLVVFTDATSDEDAMGEFRSDVVDANMLLCEVALPFKVQKLGKWDDCQWRLFDKRLTRVLSEAGYRNERYQA